ncbi:MAG TPA: hypothetical protein VHB77_19375 [Planctomycetaceae bacterium]|nr:hypothetical protein [Planctomycetaceae bacterium]
MDPFESEAPVEAQPSAASPRSRRLLRWGMLAIGGLLFCGLAAIAGTTWYRAQLQQRRVEDLLGLDVRVYASYRENVYSPPSPGDIASKFRIISGSPAFVSIQDDPPPWFQWMVAIWGPHCLARITKIETWDDRFSDHDVEQLLDLRDLRELIFQSSRLTDEGVQRLAALKRLVVLDVHEVPLSADTIRRLSECRELRELWINTSLVDADVVSELQRKLPDCRIGVWPPRSFETPENLQPER